jgi:hypothetical protein
MYTSLSLLCGVSLNVGLLLLAYDIVERTTVHYCVSQMQE